MVLCAKSTEGETAVEMKGILISPGMLTESLCLAKTSTFFYPGEAVPVSYR